MHYHCEILVPPTNDVNAAVESVMRQFDENNSEATSAFWDFWVIGGRWAGTKLMAKYDPSKLEEFEAWLQTEKITVSGLQFGKQELAPASQIAKVDAKWNEMFPSNPSIPCPMFRHSNDQHGKGLNGSLPDDVLRLRDVPRDLQCERVIFAGPSYDNDWTGPPEAKFMLCDEQWNGCNHMKVSWDGTFASALAEYLDSLKHYNNEVATKMTPSDDWLLITVDYHS